MYCHCASHGSVTHVPTVRWDWTQNLMQNDQMLCHWATFLQWGLIFTYNILSNNLSFREKLGRRYRVPVAVQPINAQPPCVNILNWKNAFVTSVSLHWPSVSKVWLFPQCLTFGILQNWAFYNQFCSLTDTSLRFSQSFPDLVAFFLLGTELYPGVPTFTSELMKEHHGSYQVWAVANFTAFALLWRLMQLFSVNVDADLNVFG